MVTMKSTQPMGRNHRTSIGVLRASVQTCQSVLTMPSQPGHRLSEMEFDEVSLVTRPANQFSTVRLFKADSPTERTMPEETDIIEDVRKNGLLDEQVTEYIDALEKANEELFSALGKADKAKHDGEDDEDDEEDEDDILKSADPRIVELVKSAERRAVTAETIAKAEREQRRDREFLAKAQTFSSMPTDAVELGRLMKSAADHLDTETFDQLVGLFAKVNSMIETGGLLDEVGKSYSVEATDSYSAIEKAAEALRSEDSSLTYEQAVEKAVTENPTLYTDHLKEG